MKKSIQCFGLLSLCALGAQAAEVPTPSCDEIRVQIRSQTGLLPKINTELLQTISRNPQCQFTSAEAYRSAYGDKPIPVHAPRAQHSRHEEEDDDD